MCSSKNCISGKESTPFNTLAQSGTTLSGDIVLTANTNKSDKVRLLSRAKRKYLSTNLALPLIDLVKEERRKLEYSLASRTKEEIRLKDKADKLKESEWLSRIEEIEKLFESGRKENESISDRIKRASSIYDNQAKNKIKKLMPENILDRTENYFTKDNLDRLEKSFWNMYKCAETLESYEGKITARYCRNRLCLVCNSIRQAVNMKNHAPVIESWKDVHFVTLTIPNIDKYNLKSSMDVMQSIFVDIKDMMNKRYKRKKGNKFLGIKKLECTYNPKRNDYHPHYHFIIEGKENAELLESEWLSRTAQKGINTSPKGQNVLPATKNVSKELFKYFTKVVTTVKGKAKNKHRIYLNSLLVMFDAFRGVRTFSKFGFKLPAVSEEELSKEEELKEPEEGGFLSQDTYVWKGKDWYSIKSGNNLTGHKPSNVSMQIVAGIRKNNIPLPFD